MHDSFIDLAKDKGWSETEQVGLLLEFIQDQDMRISLEQFLNIKANENRFARIDCTNKPLLAESLSQMAKNPELKLFKVVLGHYADPKLDEFPSSTCEVYIAATGEFEAFMPAYRYKAKEQLCLEESERKHYTIEGDPVEILVDELLAA